MKLVKLLALLVLLPLSAHAQTPWKWPGNAVAAISLTYDDGSLSQLFKAVPDLDSYGYTGTFYLHTNLESVWKYGPAWQRAFITGHEIGNHTTHHYCRAALASLSAVQLRLQVIQANFWLNRNIGTDINRTFAYPCSEEGNDEYQKAIRAIHPAARLTGSQINDPLIVDMMRLSSASFAGPDAIPMINFSELAADTGGWAILTFHGIDGAGLTIPRTAHLAYLSYLNQSGKFWVAPVRDVVRYINENR